jgi:hypothetical protein
MTPATAPRSIEEPDGGGRNMSLQMDCMWYFTSLSKLLDRRRSFISDPLTYGWVWCPLNRQTASKVAAFLGLLLARNGPFAMSAVWSLSGGKRTWRLRALTSEFDPERTWTLCQGMPSAAAQSAAPSTPASGSTQKKDFGCPFHQVEAVRSSTRDKNVFRIEELLAL